MLRTASFFTLLMLFYCCIISCRATYKDPFVQISGTQAEVHFTRKMTLSDLDSIKLKLSEHKILIEYPESFFDSGLLSKLTFSISGPNIPIGVGSTNFINLRSRNFGFKIKYDGSLVVIGEL